MRVFISSVISDFGVFRDAAAEALDQLGHEVIRAEDFPASTNSPQAACLSGVRDADLVVVLVGARYGAVQPSGVSATEEEFSAAEAAKPVLVFVQDGLVMEPAQRKFLSRIENWQSPGKLYTKFTSADDLRRKVTRAVAQHAVDRVRGPPDPVGLERRAKQLASARGSGLRVLRLSVTGGPEQVLVRPRDLAGNDLRNTVLAEIVSGPGGLLSISPGTRGVVADRTLIFKESESLVSIDDLGSVVVEQPATSGSGLGWLVVEDMEDRAQAALGLAGRILDRVDPDERLTHLALAGGLIGAGYCGWKTRDSYRRNPNSGTIGITSSEDAVVALRPPVIPRGRLRTEPRLLAEDLLALLREAHSPSRRGW